MKLLRLVMFNPETPFDREDIAQRLRLSPKTVARELAALLSMRAVKRKAFYKEIERRDAGGPYTVRRRTSGIIVNKNFPFFRELQRFLIDATLAPHFEVAKKLKKAGKITLLVASGIFMKNWEGRVDLLIVGDKIHEAALAQIVKGMEAELGKEIRYAAIPHAEFEYRRSISDRLIRDVFDYPHEVLIDRAGYFEARPFS